MDAEDEQNQQPAGAKSTSNSSLNNAMGAVKSAADDPSNMQWQTVEEAKAKDKWE